MLTKQDLCYSIFELLSYSKPGITLRDNVNVLNKCAVDNLVSCGIFINRRKKTRRGTRGRSPFYNLPDSSNVTLSLPTHNPKTQNQLHTLVINFQGIWNKQEEFTVMLSEVEPDIVLGCETWLNENIGNNELLFNDKYNVYRRDRKFGRGGGVMILIKREIDNTFIKEGRNHESLYCQISSTPKSHKQIVGVVYRPPSSSCEENQAICNELKNMQSKYSKGKLIIGGDFNLPDINWRNGCITGHQYPLHLNELFLETIHNIGLEQINNSPTRGSSILELYFTNEPDMIEDCTTIAGIGDHEAAVLVKIRKKIAKAKQPKRTIYLWKSVNWTIVKSECKKFQIKFVQEHKKDQNIDCLWKQIKDNLHKITKENVNTKKSSPNWTKPWFDGDIKRQLRRKLKWYRKLKKSRSLTAYEKFMELKKTCQKVCRNAHKNYVNNLIEEDNQNKKQLFNYIRNKTKGNFNSITELKDKQGKFYKQSKMKANILNEQFCSVFSNKSTQHHNNNDIILPIQSKMKNIKISIEGVKKLLVNLDDNKAMGPDEIHPKLLKMCAEELAPVFTLLFQSSIDKGSVPQDWKKAKIVPIFKKGDKSLPENYRPVSLTSICSKILEHIIFSRVMGHLEKHHILTDAQHGFRTKRSCETQLITTCEDFINSIENKDQTDAILLDFSKAFDKVDHQKLLLKLDACGIADNILKWIECFLTERTQKVVLEGEESYCARVESGVPQGTVLGPLLFLIYINDIADSLNDGTKIRLFADDSLLYRNIKNINDANLLQEDLTKLQIWEKQWKMEFHPKKCQLIRISNKKSNILQDYYIHGEKLMQTSNARYLGITIDHKMKWNQHINIICGKANKTLTFLQRQLQFCHPKVKEKCYKIYVRPIVEYGSNIWDPHTKENIHKLEKVQRRAARMVSNNLNHEIPTDEIMKELQWPSLRTRRQDNKIVTLFKALQNDIEIPKNMIQLKSSKTRGSHRNFSIPISRTDTHLFSFYPSTIRLWNSLPQNIKTIDSIQKFKDAIRHRDHASLQ